MRSLLDTLARVAPDTLTPVAPPPHCAWMTRLPYASLSSSVYGVRVVVLSAGGGVGLNVNVGALLFDVCEKVDEAPLTTNVPPAPPDPSTCPYMGSTTV